MTRLVLLALTLPAAAELTATFTQGEAGDTRRDRIPALQVEIGEAPTPFLEPGAFEVSWSGTLVLEARQRLHFSFEGEGRATLLVAGEEVLGAEGELAEARSDRLRLNPGEHPIEIRYTSKPDGSAHFRLFWEERSFPRQSVPPTAFKALEPAGPSARDGRELFAQAHCSKCHVAESALGPRPMSELQEIAPLLADSGGRLDEAWIAEWIATPHELKPGTRMPALVEEGDRGRQQAADLAAWLVTMKLGDPPPAPDPALAERGGELFHQLGCVACHSRPDAAERDPERIPLDRVADKFRPGALIGYLKQPDQWDPHSGMPDFMLDDEEAAALAAGRRQAAGAVERDRPSFPAGDASRGAELSKQLNCGACHAGLPLDVSQVPSLEAILAADWSAGGCVQAGPGLPDYHFDEPEKQSLVAFAQTGAASLGRHVPTEYATRKLAALRCDGCHSIDREPALLERTHVETQPLVAELLKEDERLDQSRPHLTFIGEMLHADYLRQVVDGSLADKPRPWLEMRMPAFHAHAGPLAEGLAKLHGVVPDGPGPLAADPEKIAIGRQLVGAEGFGCNTCHAVGDQPATAAFEVQGVNFAHSHERLRKEWYDRWMDNPQSVTPGSKMPIYSENGRTQRTDILGGDAAEQFDAIWHYLLWVADQ